MPFLCPVLNGEEQRGGLVIIRGSRPQQPSSQPSSDTTNAVAGPSHPPNKKFRAAPTKSPSSKSKHRSPDEDGAVEEDVRRMEMEADTPRTIHTTRTPAATPFSHSHRARHPRSRRIEQCVVRSRVHPGRPEGYRCPPAASV